MKNEKSVRYVDPDTLDVKTKTTTFNKIEKTRLKFTADYMLIELLYEMKKNTCHLMNAVMIIIQLTILVASVLLQHIFSDVKTVISIAGLIGSLIMLSLVIININISNKAMETAQKHKEIIKQCIHRLAEEE